MRLVISNILYERNQDQKLEKLQNTGKFACRNSLYDELDRINFAKYVNDFLLPELRQQGNQESYPQLEKKSSLLSMGGFLAKTDRIRVLHNWNDVFLNDESRTFLDRTFGKRITWFDAGGHMGNLYLQRVRDTLIDVSEK